MFRNLVFLSVDGTELDAQIQMVLSQRQEILELDGQLQLSRIKLMMAAKSSVMSLKLKGIILISIGMRRMALDII